MLYWFRTPPGVKVGRAALDEEAIRLIEQLNPGLEFDWTRILKGQGTPSTEARPSIDARRQRPDRRPAVPPQPPGASRPTPPPAPLASPVPAAPEIAAPELQASIDDREPAQPSEAPHDSQGRLDSGVPTPAHGRLGAEGVERLRARYAEILARISERADDPSRREELKLQADRLNPDSWVTDAEVTQGLEQYESVFASLREVIGQKRRRRRRGSRPRASEGSGPGADAIDSSRDTDSSEEGARSDDLTDTSGDDPGGGETPDES